MMLIFIQSFLKDEDLSFDDRYSCGDEKMVPIVLFGLSSILQWPMMST